MRRILILNFRWRFFFFEWKIISCFDTCDQFETKIEIRYAIRFAAGNYEYLYRCEQKKNAQSLECDAFGSSSLHAILYHEIDMISRPHSRLNYNSIKHTSHHLRQLLWRPHFVRSWIEYTKLRRWDGSRDTWSVGIAFNLFAIFTFVSILIQIPLPACSYAYQMLSGSFAWSV